MKELLNREMVKEPELPERVLRFGEGKLLWAFVDWVFHRENERGFSPWKTGNRCFTNSVLTYAKLNLDLKWS